MDRKGLICLGIAAGLPIMAALTQARRAAAAPQPNRLLTGKLIYVGPMPHGLDSWLIQDLKDWGKYQPTQEQEGSDLVLEAQWNRRRTVFVTRQGVPVPKQERPREKKQKPRLGTITIQDWVTGDQLWRADLLDEKPNSRRREPAPGPQIEIRARGLSSAQLAETLVRALRAYVAKLEAQGRPSPALQPQQHE